MMGAGTLSGLLDDLRRTSGACDSERLDDDFFSFCLKFAKPELGVEGRERDEERDAGRSVGVTRLSSDVLGGLGDGAEVVRTRGDVLLPAVAPDMSEKGFRSDAGDKSCSELEVERPTFCKRGDGGTTVTLGLVLLVSVVFRLALLAYTVSSMVLSGVRTDDGTGDAAGDGCTGLGVDGLRCRVTKPLVRGDSNERSPRSRLGVVGEALTSRARKLGAICSEIYK